MLGILILLGIPLPAQSDERDAIYQRFTELREKGRHTAAIPLAEKYLILTEEAFGREYRPVATALNGLAGPL